MLCITRVDPFLLLLAQALEKHAFSHNELRG